MKNLTFENITINGLAYAEFPVKDVDGEPVDHSKEFSYFAGCIGYTGGNQWSMNSKFENVHVRHIQIKSSATPSQNLGGLVGWIGSGGGSAGNRVAALKNCSATVYTSRDIRPVVLSDKCWAIEAYRSMIVRRKMSIYVIRVFRHRQVL